MENSLYIGLSKQVVLNENMQIIANNVANMNTPGYRGQNMVFSQFISNPRHMDEDMSQVLDYGQYQMTDPGALRETGNPLDTALVGKGFFAVRVPDGDIQYTRAGNFTMDAEGVLRTPRGYAVLDEGNAEITIPEATKNIFIDEGGRISIGTDIIATLKRVEFANDQELEQTGNGLYATEAEEIPSPDTFVKQGMVEGSNVQAVVEMTRMIHVSREYEAVQNMMKTEHDRMRNAAQKLARTQA